MRNFTCMCFCLLALVSTYVSAQSIERQAVVSAAKTGTTASYSIGETVVTTAVAAGDAFLIAGFQQPFVTSEPALSVSDISESLSVYPNPSRDLVNIAGEGVDFTNAEISLFTLEGKKVSIGIEKGVQLRLDISRLPANIYWLNIQLSDNKKAASFKLIKN
ncbi:T9SS type A sorting domain-containing protein [Ekhidna sp.]|uniref:T9SS type A sorting domain-containing protein n=1 Tax=Ekhidna sp. TaxID=2608089 RepID=UPI003C7D5458